MCSACAAVVSAHATYGATAPAMAIAAAPDQLVSSSSDSTVEYPAANSSSCAASAAHADAAASSGPEPGPEYILAELISGGSIPKSSIGTLSVHGRSGFG
ncbi:hypothetical protein A4G31_06805 [Mycobacterium persicum]|nr:hypothetical protein A4G31_06805 [Mycobacterium persicum]